jgi:hypothetical protein
VQTHYLLHLAALPARVRKIVHSEAAFSPASRYNDERKVQLIFGGIALHMSETSMDPQGETSTREASIAQQKQSMARQQRIERWFEVATAVILGLVAVATAWSGYQATRWSGEQSAKYAEANALRVESTLNSTLATQYELYDVIIFNNWLNASIQGNSRLADIYMRRFRPEFLPAFEAWLATDPFHNPNAPPGPLLMPQYKLSLSEQASQLDAKASRTFDDGQRANEQSDAYVRNTVILAVALFLAAVADSFSWNEVRAVILLVALGLLLFGIYRLITYPII